MAFTLSLSGVEYIKSYPEALAMFERAKPQVPSGVGQRKIPGHNRPKTGISKYGDEIAFRYYRTDVVTWRADGTCVMDLSYGSRSTAHFADHFAPWDISVLGEGDVLLKGNWRTGTYYATTGRVTISPDGLIDGTRTITRKRIDRGEAKKAIIAENYPAFVEFYQPLANFWGSNLHSGERFGEAAILRMLHDPEQWDALARAATFGWKCSPETFLSKLRDVIYRQHGSFRFETLQSATSYATMRKWIREGY